MTRKGQPGKGKPGARRLVGRYHNVSMYGASWAEPDRRAAAWAIGRTGEAVAWAEGTATPEPGDHYGAAVLAMQPTWRHAFVRRYLLRRSFEAAEGHSNITEKGLASAALAFIEGYLACAATR